MKKLFVGNLPYQLEDGELSDLFGGNGRTVVEAKIIYDRETGRSKGFGFVEMSSPAEADEAINELNGHNLGGRPLRVDFAKPSKPRERR